MHKVVAYLSLFAAGAGAGGLGAQDASRTISTAELIASVTHYRRMVLRDSIPIDFCAIADAFDASGRFRVPPNTPAPRYLTQAECRQAASVKRPLGAVVQSVRSVGDTVLVTGYMVVGGFICIEEYRLEPLPFRLPSVRLPLPSNIGLVRRYTILGLVQE